MASSMKYLVLYGEKLGPPNPYKVQLILSDLGLPYEVKTVAQEDIKGPEYTAINPNGRLPALYDPNTDITLWESGAIIQYVIAEYDKEHKLSFPAGSKEAHLVNQWMHFQMSGQGPYYGQASWFVMYHPEKVPSAIERYKNEINRVTMVLDKWLADKEYLVGNKCTYADLSFIAWQEYVPRVFPDLEIEKNAPNVTAWMERMHSRPAVAEMRRKRMEEVSKY